MKGQWDVKLLLLEGPTDISFFAPLLKKVYGFREAPKDLHDKIPLGKNFENPQSSPLSRPICLVKDNQAVVMFHIGGKDRLSKALKLVISSLHIWEEHFRPNLIGVARDIDTEHDVVNWARNVLSSFNPVERDGALVVNDVEVVPFGIGSVEINNPNVYEKKELELLLTALAEKESTLSQFERSLNQLKEDAQRRLKPKDVMHVLAIAKDYDGDSMSGLYRKFVEKLINEKPELIEGLLRESGLKEFLDRITG